MRADPGRPAGPDPAPPPGRQLIVATAGHVDHGKTALVRRITGTDTDTLAEEKARGLSIAPGYAYLHYRGEDGAAGVIGFVDVPGHTDFIHNMLAAVGSVDGALLVVAADDGVMPQTREHLAILSLLGVSRGCVALTKIDRCEPARVEASAEAARALLADTPLAGAPLFRVSSLTGEGVDGLVGRLKAAGAPAPRRPGDRRLRYLIDRAFTVKGIGTVVTGSVRAGLARAGQTAAHTGSGRETRLKALRLDARDIDGAAESQRAAVSIGVPRGLVRRGDWLLDPALNRPIDRFDAEVAWLEAAPAPRPGADCHLFLGASHRLVKLRPLDAGRELYRLRVREPVFACQGDRFILRDPASQRTIGGGAVIDTFAPRRGGGALRLRELAAMRRPDAADALAALIELLPEGVDLDRFALNRNLSGDGLERLLREMRRRDEPWLELEEPGDAPPRLLGREHFRAFRQAALDALAARHRRHPEQRGLDEAALKTAMGFRGTERLFGALVRRLARDRDVAREGTVLRLPSHQAAPSREEETFFAKIRPALEAAGSVPPRTRELVELTGIALGPLEAVLRRCARAGHLVRVAANRHYLPETVAELAALAERLAGDDGFTVVQFRDASGIGRNLCIEVLEHFDSIGFTRRRDNVRFLQAGGEKPFGR